MKINSMSIKDQFNLMLISSILVVLIVGFLIEYVSDYFIILLFIYAFFVGNYFSAKECANCKQKIFYRNVDFIGMNFPVCVPWVSKKCHKCGELID